MSNCPCGHPLEIRTVTNLSFHCEAEVVTCMCGKIREHYEPDPKRAKFIQFTNELMGREVFGSCKSNETSIDKFKILADSL